MCTKGQQCRSMSFDRQNDSLYTKNSIQVRTRGNAGSRQHKLLKGMVEGHTSTRPATIHTHMLAAISKTMLKTAENGNFRITGVLSCHLAVFAVRVLVHARRLSRVESRSVDWSSPASFASAIAS